MAIPAMSSRVTDLVERGYSVRFIAGNETFRPSKDAVVCEIRDGDRRVSHAKDTTASKALGKAARNLGDKE